MHFSTLTLAVMAALSMAAPSNPKAVKFPFTKSTNSLNSRAVSNPSVTLGNEEVYYSIQVSYGNPPQSFEVSIDTGSTENWVRENGTPGSFDPSKSTTFQMYRPGAFFASYQQGTTDSGDYVKDTIRVGDITINDYIFGLAKKTAGAQIMGIGFKSNEFTSEKYDNFPVRLAKEGYTNTVAFSIYLNSRFAKSGNLLFGAVDTAKFEDSLALLPLVKTGPTDPAPNQFIVTLDGVEFNGQNTLPQPRRVVLDTGTTNTVVPTIVYWGLFKELGLYQTKSGPMASQSQYDMWTADKSSITYNFQGKKIEVPLAQLFEPRSDYVTTPSGQEKAYFWRLQEHGTNDDIFILGDTFLRSAYVAFDLDNFRVGMGQAKYDDSEEKIEAISSGGIPSATPAPQAAPWSTDLPITASVAKPTSTVALGPKSA